MTATSIEWTDATWNPTRGCSRVSEGCRNCYAERIAARFSRRGGAFQFFADRYQPGSKWTGKVALVPEKLDEPLRWRKPRRVFVNSMSDLFHEALSDEAIDQVFVVMAATFQRTRHTFQILTKRPARMLRYLSDRDRLDLIYARWRATIDWGSEEVEAWPLPNVWLGVSVEDQATADERIPLLLQTPAAVRYVSYEPALGPVDFGDWLFRCDGDCSRPEALHGEPILDWVIVGGESGPGARPFDLAWARSTVDQCRAAGVPAFVKQLGARPFDSSQTLGPGECVDSMVARMGDRVRNPKGSDPAEWPEGIRVREFPSSPHTEAL